MPSCSSQGPPCEVHVEIRWTTTPSLTPALASSNIAARNVSVKCFRHHDAPCSGPGGSVESTVATRYREIMTVDPPDSLTSEQQAQLQHRFASVWGAAGLGRRERRLVTIACVAFAVTPEPITEQVYAALKSGDLTIEEMLEVVLHFAVYCGWPKASNLEMYVRQAWVRVQEEQGLEPAPLPPLRADNAELGTNDWEERIARGAEEFR